MQTVGIICEYNPLHLGHRKQLRLARELGADGIVCIMSGNFVQRGAPAIIDKSLRAAAAVDCGADLVLELPVTAALNSAEGFAREGVRLLGGFCDRLCFGAETANEGQLMTLAEALLNEDFPPALRLELEKGCSFPAARAAALVALGLDASPLSSPNNILAVEYCKAILSQGLRIKPMVIHREGDYHDLQADPENPSATFLRKLMLNGRDWAAYLPETAAKRFQGATLHTMAAGERAVLARLRTMTKEDFKALPFGSEGLWRKLMHESRRQARLEDIAEAVKSKRYTRTRIDRMILCGFLGLTQENMNAPAPYARVLAFNDRGRAIVKQARTTGLYPNIGQRTNDPFEVIEQRCDDLYGLFAQDQTEAAGICDKRRVYHAI